MSRRTAPPITLRDFQAEARDQLAGVALETLRLIARAPRERHRIARRMGCALLCAPTGSGKTMVLSAVAEQVSLAAPVVWFWFAPFTGLIEQTARALRAAAPGLRVRQPSQDRNDTGTRSGDVFIMTWASVAARNAETRRLRTEDDIAPSLDVLVQRLRQAGLALGAIVDEAHHSFRRGTQAFDFLNQVLDPDLLLCATATPDDADMETLRRALDVPRFQRVTVSRESVLKARLNKKQVRAVSFVAHGPARNLIDLNETALRKAVEQHRALKAELRKAGYPIVPLLLVQAASTAWTPDRIRRLLLESLNFSEGSVAVHTAAEPDPNVQALADEPNVEVLIFKMAVATGFDAPRAFTLCALRPVVDAGFGLQVVGRIMRVHSLLQPRHDLPPSFDTGWVFLGDAQGQAGLQEAADRIKAIRDSIDIVSDGVTVYEAAVGADGFIAIVDADGQSVLVLEPPTEAAATYKPGTGTQPNAGPPMNDTLFGQLAASAPAGAAEPGPSPPTPSAGQARASAQPMAFRYPQRSGLPVPECLRTEQMPTDCKGLMAALIRKVRFTPDHFAAARRSRADVERQESNLFDSAQRDRRHEQTAISEFFARESAHALLRVSEYIDPAELARGLVLALADAMRADGQDVPPERELRRALNIVLVQFPLLLKDALRRAMADCADVVNAAPLPASWDSNQQLPRSDKNLYGVLPELNNWERRFADWLDRQPHVRWWLRNQDRRPWAARIVLPETGRGYYPDFVVCIEGRPKRDNLGLIETKERTEDERAASKSRSEHREYGRALMLRYDPTSDQFIRVEYAPERDRNREAGPLQPDDLLA